MTGVTRRAFLAGLGLSTLTSWQLINASVRSSTEADPESGGAASAGDLIESWMETWMDERSREPIGTLHLSRFVEPVYYLVKPITWRPNAGQESLAPVTVPSGFVTDLASIPRPFFTLLRPDGQYTYPAIVHDYLYWTQDRPRKTCDLIFKMGMEEFGIAEETISTIHLAVRRFGGLSWRSNGERRRRGEKRILTKFPTDPRARWADWRQRTDVFE